MKKNLFAALLLALVATTASAQFKWGVEGGLNLSKISVSNVSASTRTGFFIGPKAQVTIPMVGLMLDGALQYSQTSMETGIDVPQADGTTIEKTKSKTLPYLVIPVNIKYGIGLGSFASVYISTGPQWNYYLGSKSTWNSLLQVSPKSNSMYWNVGVGAHLAKHFQVGLTYNIALGDNVKFSDVNVIGVAGNVFKGKNNTWQVRLAYMF